ncbi:hypothetical protein [Kitasatospora purpeofusca]|uniref:hypothetical protein n=1 Tax=Kitasatospora purpeofusca TaxID=67352 RepID=UPI0036CEB761
MVDQPFYPAVTAFSGAVEDLIRERSLGRSTIANLRWVARDLEQAAQTDEFPPAARSTLEALLTLQSWDAYARIAGAGLTRVRTGGRIRQGGAMINSMRTRATAWNTVAKYLGIAVRFPLPATPTAHLPVPADQRQMLLHQLSQQVRTPMAEADRIRTLALLGVVTDTGARSGELVAMTLDSLATDLSTIELVRNPQGPTGPYGIRRLFTESIRLSPFTRSALRMWLRVRTDLVESVQGSSDALWVSLRNNHGRRTASGSLPRTPSGMPLQVRGLERAYSRAIVRVNEELAGQPGWTPVARTLEQLRRSIKDIKVEALAAAA